MNKYSAPTTVVIPRVGDYHPISVTVGRELGKGSFGKTYHASIKDHSEPLVFKEMSLPTSYDEGIFTPHQHLRLGYREILYLSKQNLLLGYQHDQENHKLYILMKLLPGKQEYHIGRHDKDQTARETAEKASVRALFDLHRENVAHMDPHESNFIYDPRNQSSKPIDFGFSEDYHALRGLYDFHSYIFWRYDRPFILSPLYLIASTKILAEYIKQLKDNWPKYKDEAINIGLSFGIVMLGVFGATAFPITAFIARLYIKAKCQQYLSQALETLQGYNELLAWDRENDNPFPYMLYTLILTSLQAGLMYYQFSTLFSASQSLLKSVVEGTLKQTTTLYELVKSACSLKFLSQSKRYWQESAEKYFYSKEGLMSHYEHEIEMQSKHYTPFYQREGGSNTSAANENISAHQRASRPLSVRLSVKP